MAKKVLVSGEAVRKVARLGERASAIERRVRPMQIAAQLLEDAVAQCAADPPQS